jgi:hypothetical protein
MAVPPPAHAKQQSHGGNDRSKQIDFSGADEGENGSQQQ